MAADAAKTNAFRFGGLGLCTRALFLQSADRRNLFIVRISAISLSYDFMNTYTLRHPYSCRVNQIGGLKHYG